MREGQTTKEGRLRRKKLSLNHRLAVISVAAFVPMVLVMIYLMISLSNTKEAYSEITRNITYANQYIQEFKGRIDYSMYLAVISQKSMEELGNEEMQVNGYVTVNPYEYIHQLSQACDNMAKMATVSSNRNVSRRVKKTLHSLERCVRTLEEGIGGDWTYQEKMDYFDQNITNLTTLITEGIQDYVYVEITNYEQVRSSLDREMHQSLLLCIGVSILAIATGVWLSVHATRSITAPVQELCDMTEKVAEGDFSVRAKECDTREIAILSRSFNQMTGEIDRLIDNIKQQQRDLHLTETKLLQAQINPHFLYNTLDAIVWLAEEHKSEEVVHMVTALSAFFRTSLSKGRDFITIREEESHIRSYLEIQQFRYQDILDYRIEIGEDIYDYMIPKLTLQPLVENALYHGIKNKRGRGMILIRGDLEGDNLIFLVHDNGRGMTRDKLEDLRHNLDKDTRDEGIDSFGLVNVHRRLRYYYGVGYGLTFESTQNEETEVRVTIKAKKNEPFI